MSIPIEIKPTNECDFCISCKRIPFSVNRKCEDPDKNLYGKVNGYPSSFDLSLKFEKCQHFTPNPEKI